MLRGVPSAALFDSSIHAGYGSIPAPRAAAVDFRQSFLKINFIPHQSNLKHSYF